MTPDNAIIHSDCTTGMAKLSAASVDFVLTDPPYLIDYRARDGRSVANDDNTRWLRPAFSQIYRVLKPASFCVSFYAWNKVHLFMAAWRDVGFRPVGHIIFRKRYAGIVTVTGSGRLAGDRRNWRHEAATRPTLSPSLSRRDHQPRCLAVSRVQPQLARCRTAFG